MRGMLLCVIFLVAVAGSGIGQTNEAQWFCKGETIPLKSSQQPISLGFGDPLFSSNDEYSSSDIRVSNLGTEDIIRFLVVIDYLNDRSQRLVSIGHYYEDWNLGKEELTTNFSGYKRFAALVGRQAFWGISNGEKGGPITKGGGQKVVPGMGALTVTHCPSAAMITALAVEYSNGEVKTFFAPGWHLDIETPNPVLGWLRDVVVAKPLLADTGGFQSLAVAANGCASVPVAQTTSANWMTSSVPHWYLSPAQTDGKGEEQIVVLATEIRSKEGVQRSWRKDEKLPEVVAVIHLYTDGNKASLNLGTSPIQTVEQCGCQMKTCESAPR